MYFNHIHPPLPKSSQIHPQYLKQFVYVKYCFHECPYINCKTGVSVPGREVSNPHTASKPDGVSIVMTEEYSE